jgi:hypothetical protein
MAFDALLLLASETGLSATKSDSTALDLGAATGDASKVFWARVEVTAGSASGSDVTLTFSVSHSADNSTFYAHTSAADQVVTITSGGSTRDKDVVWIPIVPVKRYQRLVMTKGGGTLASGAYNAYITNSYPH